MPIDDSNDTLIGAVIDRRLRILSRLGQGGMGAVYLAEHLSLGRKFAVKILRQDLSERREFAERFQREAQAATHIDHPNVIEVIDTGYLPGGAAYYVMEHLAGEDLAATLRSEKRLPWPRARHMALQICDVLATAHAQGIVHRDLKPANCFRIRRRGDPDFIKVLDFGIAKLLDDTSESLTNTGDLLGTALYMAPEQAQGERIDHRVDIYALGAVLYHLLTGRVPYPGRNHYEVLSALLLRTPEPFAVAAPGVVIPHGVEAIVLQALEKNPDLRFSSMTALAEALDRVATGGGTALPSVVHSPPPTPAERIGARALNLALPPTLANAATAKFQPPNAVYPRTEASAAPVPIRRPLWVWTIALGVTASALLTYTLLRSVDTPTDDSATPVAVGGTETSQAADPTSRAQVVEPSSPKPSAPPPVAPASTFAPDLPVTLPASTPLDMPRSAPAKKSAKAPTKVAPTAAPAQKTVKDIKAILREAAVRVQANCHSEFPETVHVSVHIEAKTGELRHSNVLPPHDLSRFRGCIEGKLQSIRFPPFTGGDYVEDYAFQLNPETESSRSR